MGVGGAEGVLGGLGRPEEAVQRVVGVDADAARLKRMLPYD